MKFIKEETNLGNTYRFLGPGEEARAITMANEILLPYGFTAEMMPENIMSRGNQGDHPSYTRVICITGPFVKTELLQKISVELTNKIPVNRIMFDFSSP